MTPTTPTPPDMPGLKSCPLCCGKVSCGTYGWPTIRCYDCKLELHGNDDGWSKEKVIKRWNTRPTPPADALPTEEDDYPPHWSVSDIVRYVLAEVELITRKQSPAPVTDAQREAADKWITALAKEDGDFLTSADFAAIKTIRAALTSPAQAQVDVESAKHDALSTVSYECLAGGVCGKEDAFLVGKGALSMFNHITAHYHLTPKTQGEE